MVFAYIDLLITAYGKGITKVGGGQLREMEKNNHPILLVFLSVFDHAETVT